MSNHRVASTMATIRLYHADPSYYSMIARLALAIGDIPYESCRMDIHRDKTQLRPEYAAINPHLTVPTLKVGDRTLADSRDILTWVVRERPEAFILGELDAAILDAHYALSIENLTFGRTMLRFAPLRWFFPKLLARVCGDLRQRNVAHPELADVYEAKIRQNEARIRFFSEGDLSGKIEALRHQSRDLIKMIPTPVGDYLWGDHPSPSDVILTVFLARLVMIGERDLVADRPDLVRWFGRMQETEAYAHSDIWTRFSLRQIFGSH